MNQPYFIITLIATLALGVLSINAEITFAQEKNETSEMMILLKYNYTNR